MSNYIIANFQRIFPPMFKRGEGLDYTLAIFRRRVMTFFWASVILAASFAICWVVVPPSLAEWKDWYFLLTRASVAAFAIFLFYKMVVVFRHIECESASYRSLRTNVGDDEDYKELAQAFAGIIAVASLTDTSPSYASTHIEEPVQRIIFDLLCRTGSINEFVQIKDTPRRETTHDDQFQMCIAYGNGLPHLVKFANLKLVSLDKSAASDLFVPEKIVRKLESIADPRIRLGFEFAPSKHIIVSLPGLVDILRTHKDQALSTLHVPDDRQNVAKATVRWLLSIRVGIVDAANG